VKANQIYYAVLKYIGVLAVVLAVVGGALGFVFAGPDGLVSALLGTVVAVMFSGITVVSIIVALRFEIIGFFGTIMGAWLLKFLLFIAAVAYLRDQPFIQPVVIFVSLIVGVTATIMIDCVVVYRSRMSYISDISLPQDTNDD
jgi:hypothetical protein